VVFCYKQRFGFFPNCTNNFYIQRKTIFRWGRGSAGTLAIKNDLPERFIEPLIAKPSSCCANDPLWWTTLALIRQYISVQ